MAQIIGFIVAAMCIIPTGNAIRCYSYFCSKVSVGPQQNCTPPVPVQCPSDPSNPMLQSDRCSKQTIVMKQTKNPPQGPMTIELSQEIRNCSSSFRCNPTMHKMVCEASNTTGAVVKCDSGCCQGDLCNGDGPMPSAPPQPTGPTGSSLSCYVCSNEPEKSANNCSEPVLKRCSGSRPPQDRCVTLKATGRDPRTGAMRTLETRNCSHSVGCNSICAMINSTGDLTSCTSNCCIGNGCNTEGVSTTPDSAGTATTPGSPTIKSSADKFQFLLRQPVYFIVGIASSFILELIGVI